VGTGTPGYSGDGAEATEAQLNGPFGVSMDSSGNLYIGDAINSRIRKVLLTGSRVTETPTVTPALASSSPAVDFPLPIFVCTTTGNINEVCNYSGRTVTDLEIQSQGMISNGILAGTLVSTGWVSNFTITATGKLSGGVVTGYIKNDGVMRDFKFVGMSIIGGTLGGVIQNNSDVGGYFQDVTLQANTKITGGSLKGTIKGDKNTPAVLEDVRVKSGSKLSGVKLGKNVTLEKGVVVEDKQ
jgi:hypothetical protein